MDATYMSEWIKKVWYIHAMGYYSVIKRNAFESVLVTRMNRQPITYSSKPEREKQIAYINAYMRNLERQS